jgi:DNA-binding winged helix-turn-helix (wHTH) protein
MLLGKCRHPAVRSANKENQNSAANAMKFVFGDFTFDLDARQLLRANTPVPLEPKMYKLLEILIKRRPAVVANEELDELLWPHVFVARTSLTRLVSELRSVLGDEPRDSQIIRTAYKTGYAFCAPIASPTATTRAGYEKNLATIQLAWRDRLIPLADGEHIAGRGEECSLVIDASTVSRRHAKFTVSGTTIVIEDLGSTNGTRVNGVQISSPTPLPSGSKFELGTEILQILKRNSSALTVRIDVSGAAHGTEA